MVSIFLRTCLAQINNKVGNNRRQAAQEYENKEGQWKNKLRTTQENGLSN